MARKEYPFILSNSLDKFLRIKQARETVRTDKAVTLQDIYTDMAKYMGVTENTVGLIKSGNYNPSLVVAMALAKYLDVKVDDLFTITSRKDG